MFNSIQQLCKEGEICKDLRVVGQSPLCRSWHELCNDSSITKIGFDTAENEPCEVGPLGLSLVAKYGQRVNAPRGHWLERTV